MQKHERINLAKEKKKSLGKRNKNEEVAKGQKLLEAKGEELKCVDKKLSLEI